MFERSENRLDQRKVSLRSTGLFASLREEAN